MQKKRLGHTDMEITPIGFGAWAIGGNGWKFGWGAQDDSDSIAAIHEALDAGINWIDTAAVYGLGRSEEVVARALEGIQQRPYVFTKCERVWNEQREVGKCLKADSIRRECEASLRRLRVDVIDLYQIHWPEPDEDIEEGWSTLVELQQAGKVRWIGVSNFNVSQLERAAAIAPIASLQPPYSLINRKIERDILPYCEDHRIGVISYSPMASGLLTGAMTRNRLQSLPEDDWRKHHVNYTEPALSRNLNLVELLTTIGQENGQTPGQAAVCWVLRQPALTGAIVGARKPGQILETVAAADQRLSPGQIARIDRFLSENPLPA